MYHLDGKIGKDFKTGFLLKKTLVCTRCGKEYEARLDITGGLCGECWKREKIAKRNLMNQVNGYNDYALDVLSKEYTSDELQKIVTHRAKLMNKGINKEVITKNELRDANYFYKQLPAVQCEDIVHRSNSSIAYDTLGATYTWKSIFSTKYENVIVSAEDIYAVGYTTDFKYTDVTAESILCVIFTNNPYIPVLPMCFFAQKGLFELIASKKGRIYIEFLFELMCPNLQYPVSPLKQLKKTIKEEKRTRGNLDKEFMLNKIGDA